MKVDYSNPILFRGTTAITKPDNIQAKKPQTIESTPVNGVTHRALPEIYPSYDVKSLSIKAPQKYTKLGVTEFAGGLKLHSYKLANGHTISIIPMEGSPATVKNYVNVGAMNEPEDVKGISHFLEHMAFNGTTGENGYIKLETGDSFKKVDNLGGWTNASTSYAVTDYINSTPLLEEKDLEEQIKIIASMTEDLALTEEMIEKEKGPVCSEINMIMDDPSFIGTDQTVRSLFGIKSTADDLVGGSTYHIKNLTRDKVKEYYDKHYTPDNMNLVITGNVNPDEVIELVAKNFHSNKVSHGKKYEERLKPIDSPVRKDIIFDKAKSAYITLGFAGPKNNDTKANIAYDILIEYLNSTNLGIQKEFDKINASSFSGNEKISNNPNNQSLIYYNIECSEENSEVALKIIHDKLSNLKAPNKEDLEKIKERILLAHKEATQYSLAINNFVGHSILNGNLEYATKYEEILKSITAEDMQKFIDKYIDTNKVAITVIHPETTKENIFENYNNAKQLSFKGKRVPVNSEKVHETTLDNNFKVLLYETNNDNITFDINLTYPALTNINPTAISILEEILTMGKSGQDKDSYKKYLEDNNIDVYSSISNQNLYIGGFSAYNDFEKASKLVNEILYSPNITQENFEKAKDKLKDTISRHEVTSRSLYVKNESNINPLYNSIDSLSASLETVTIDDVKALHQYILNNSSGAITMNTPVNKDIKNKAYNEFVKLNSVNPFEYNTPNVYIPNTQTQVLTAVKNNAQADIMETFKFEYNNTPKERATIDILNTLLSSSASIGLFSTLREKEHLAYRVGSDYNRIGNCGELSCHILTTTDNKEIGEISYDNIQKSINGFNRQINALLNSEYTDEDLESAKRKLKANLLINESTDEKLDSIQAGIKTAESTEYLNKVYDEIDKLTREDIQKYAEKVFANKPIYSIVASYDTLEANRDFFETL